MNDDSLPFLRSAGVMGERLRTHDWSGTPLGPLSLWPVSLRTAAGLVLGSRFPAALVWGSELTTLYNDAFRPILGTKPEALGRSFRDVWDEAWDRIGPIAARAFAGEATFIEDFPLVVQRNGAPEEAFFTFCYSPVYGEDGRVAGMLDTVVETTQAVRGRAAVAAMNASLEAEVEARTRELMKTRDALRQSQKMEAIGNLTGGIAHDFNNLLQVVGGNLQLLGPAVAGDVAGERHLVNALAGVTRGATLTAQLLAFGRRQPLAPQAVDLGRLVRGMDEMLRRTLGEAVAVETIVARGLWSTMIDPGNVENALLNLAINARDAMKESGSLTIEVGNALLDEDYARRTPGVTAGPYVLLAVTDTGCGMTPEILEKAFDPFFTTKPEGKGSGLGLSMVYGFVKQSGGHVALYSEPGQGTTVRLYLPRSGQPAQAPAEAPTGPVVGGSETILVAEDDEAVRETAIALLSDLGYRVLRARDAQGALAIVESGVPIDLLFTDVVMPGPLKSTELARRARAQLPGLAVLYTSGYTENAIVHGGRLDEGIDLLSKPYSRADLARKVRQVLGGGAAAGGAAAPPAMKEEPMVESPADGGLRILLVEDDGLIRLSAADMLADLGHVVFEAGDGAEALVLLDAEPIDVLVTDLSLPGMSGQELAVEALTRLPGLRIVFATGHDPVTGPDGRIQGTAAVLLRKPYGVAGLVAALRSALA